MASYMFKRNRDGIHIINISKTWEKMMIAARIIASIKNPKDVLVSLKLSGWPLTVIGRFKQGIRTESYP
jgi:ribosomal protein S2